MTTAPVCPITRGEVGFRDQPPPARMPGFPWAQDLASLLRLINMLADALKAFVPGTTTINNVWNPPPPFTIREGNTIYSAYPDWEQTRLFTANGYVFHKDQNGEVDRSQRVHVRRTNAVEYQNEMQTDPDFYWQYYLQLDQ